MDYLELVGTVVEENRTVLNKVDPAQVANLVD